MDEAKESRHKLRILPALGLVAAITLIVSSLLALFKGEGAALGSELAPLVPNVNASEAVGRAKPILGPLNASTRFVIFSDFQCPSCGAEWDVLKKFAAKHPDVGIYFRELPLENIHPMARKAAVAAEIARIKGKFVDVADRLESATLTDESISQCLNTSGISKKDQEQLKLEATMSVEGDLALAGLWQLHSTPTLLCVAPDGKVYHVLQFNRPELVYPQ
jgi:hypothetical protein